MSLYARLAILLVLVLAIAGAWWKFDRMLAAADKAGYERRAGEDKAAADAQAQSNRDLQRASEKRYTVVAEVRDRFITTTITEVRHATAALAACPVGPDAVRLFNAAAGCARADPAAACGAGEPLPLAR